MPTRPSGKIVRFERGLIHGWYCRANEADPALPLIHANGITCPLLAQTAERPDLDKRFGLSGTFGFRCRLPMDVVGEVEVTLDGLSAGALVRVDTCALPVRHRRANTRADFLRTLEVSRTAGAVGVVVWDIAGNPAGRASVLCDTAAIGRPVALFGFYQDPFGPSFWPTLAGQDLAAFAVGPGELGTFAADVERTGMAFNTVWICKPRLPSFELAEILAAPGAARILDIDDNEDAFMAAAERPFLASNSDGASRAHWFVRQTPVRSVASPSLQARFGGRLVRHVRAARPVADAARQHAAPDDPLTLMMFGTIRPHKGAIEAAQRIRDLKLADGRGVRLVVGGEFFPPQLKAEFQNLDADVLGPASAGEAADVLSRCDVVLARFPAAEENRAITDFQVPAKLSDALQARKPVLVPRTPAVDDLADVPGIFLFDDASFESALQAAAEFVFPDGPSLPESFTQAHAFQTFLALEAEAAPSDRPLVQTRPAGGAPRKRNVVLLWKQLDGGLYGRRVDQVGRTLLREGVADEVICFEFVDWAYQLPFGRAQEFGSDQKLRLADFKRKLAGSDADGISHHIVQKPRPQQGRFVNILLDTLRAMALFPEDTIVIIFPIVPLDNGTLVEIQENYVTVTDLVDNNLITNHGDYDWDYFAQYMLLYSLSRQIIANNGAMMQFVESFAGRHRDCVAKIPNWYHLPAGVLANSLPETLGRDLIYSGYLDHRIDWELMAQIAQYAAQRGLQFHIVGSAEAQMDLVRALCAHECVVFHGPLRETQTLELCAQAACAVVPHMRNEVSEFMDPLKLRMYDALALPYVVTDARSRLGPVGVAAGSHAEFLQQVRHLSSEAPAQRRSPGHSGDADAKHYARTIEDLWTLVDETFHQSPGRSVPPSEGLVG